MEHVERESIKQVIEEAYIRGIHGDQDERRVKDGFHQDFAMLVLKDNAIEKVTVDEWLDRIEASRVDNPHLWSVETTRNFVLIDVTRNAAVAKLDVYKGEKYFATDYMLLYKFVDGWKIVSKVFAFPG